MHRKNPRTFKISEQRIGVISAYREMPCSCYQKELLIILNHQICNRMRIMKNQSTGDCSDHFIYWKLEEITSCSAETPVSG